MLNINNKYVFGFMIAQKTTLLLLFMYEVLLTGTILGVTALG